VACLVGEKGHIFGPQGFFRRFLAAADPEGVAHTSGEHRMDAVLGNGNQDTDKALELSVKVLALRRLMDELQCDTLVLTRVSNQS
jgi:hypothetical protein